MQRPGSALSGGAVSCTGVPVRGYAWPRAAMHLAALAAALQEQACHLRKHAMHT